MLDPLMVALWQATMAERRGQTKSAPGLVRSGSGLSPLCARSYICDCLSLVLF